MIIFELSIGYSDHLKEPLINKTKYSVVNETPKNLTLKDEYRQEEFKIKKDTVGVVLEGLLRDSRKIFIPEEKLEYGSELLLAEVHKLLISKVNHYSFASSRVAMIMDSKHLVTAKAENDRLTSGGTDFIF